MCLLRVAIVVGVDTGGCVALIWFVAICVCLDFGAFCLLALLMLLFGQNHFCNKTDILEARFLTRC